MQQSSHQSSRIFRQTGIRVDVPRIALNEHELAARWRLSVKTLRRWRQGDLLGPVF